jgi:hypothetical protein
VIVNGVALDSVTWDRATGDLVVSVPFGEACDVIITNA